VLELEAQQESLDPLEGEPLSHGETASKTEVAILSWPHERFFSSLAFATVASALYQLGSA